jgi:hypothetical protein
MKVIAVKWRNNYTSGGRENYVTIVLDYNVVTRCYYMLIF